LEKYQAQTLRHILLNTLPTVGPRHLFFFNKILNHLTAM